MASFINTNIASLNAQRNLTTSQSSLNSALQRLSSGLRINSAKDDAAGLAISQRMTSQINGANQAARNANDGISLAQTAEGDLTQIGTNLQRMRDLAVQSANASNSASDRAFLNNEFMALAQEIDRVAQTSSFNGVKLLDGSFTSQAFQVGANATSNDQITIDAIASARTSNLGATGTTQITTVKGNTITGALSAGNLTLNGIQVGASTAGTGGGLTAASATQVAAAINAVSSQSGVKATAEVNTVTGAAATVHTAMTAGTFSINGVSVGAVAAGGDARGQGANVAAAINLVSAQTGVTASADAATGALTLKAADGRDINVTVNDPTAGNMTTFLNKTGLSLDKVSAAGTTVTMGAYATTTSGATDDRVNITIDGLTVFAAADKDGATAGQIATDINTFITNNNTAYGVIKADGSSGTLNAADITAGGWKLFKKDGTAVNMLVNFTAAGGGAATGPLGGGFTGVTNQNNTTTATQLAAAGAGAVENHGKVTLTSTNSSGIYVGGGSVATAGLSAGNTPPTTVASVKALSSADISSAAGATEALAIIDGAMDKINSSRASLGAFQNRFASVVTSLQTTAENLSASRSRIQDADFASETATLTRGQILQQAGTAMLAQANSLPNGVLALLRG